MIWESMERELGFSEGCGMGEWGRQKRLLQRKSSLFVCLPYSAHAIGFRLSLPLLTFSTPDLRDSPHIHTSSAAVLSDSCGNIIAAVSKKHALVDVNAGELSTCCHPSSQSLSSSFKEILSLLSWPSTMLLPFLIGILLQIIAVILQQL